MGASAQWTLVTDVVTYYCSLRREEDAVKVHAEAKWALSHGRIQINRLQLTIGRTACTNQAGISICSRTCLENLA